MTVLNKLVNVSILTAVDIHRTRKYREFRVFWRKRENFKGTICE